MLLAGFDAGQSQTRCRISKWDSSGWHHLAYGNGAGVSHLKSAGGEKLFCEGIRSSLKNCLRQIGKVKINAAVIGASGIDKGTYLQKKATTIFSEELGIPLSNSLATGDEQIALRGAFPDRAGIVLISGTGMICLGRNRKGDEHRCGGWGWLLDGEGSAFDLGQKGLQLSLKMADGRVADHELRQQLWEALDCKSCSEIKAKVVQSNFGPANFASLAPIVVNAAEQGLKPANFIIDQSANSLAVCVKTVADQLELNRPEIIAHGGAVKHIYIYQKSVRAAIKQLLPESTWAENDFDACNGALEMALEMVLRLN